MGDRTHRRVVAMAVTPTRRIERNRHSLGAAEGDKRPCPIPNANKFELQSLGCETEDHHAAAWLMFCC
jgi:hypothetical protein